MAKKSAFQDRPSIVKCKRMVRPLISKIHGLTDLYVKYPSKFAFDLDLFTSAKVDGGNLRFTHPSTASDRLVSLKPFISSELYQAYVEIFSIFRNIILTVCDPNKVEGPMPKLAGLAARSLGKSVTLGTKSTFYKLNQTMLFEQGTIPRHLQRFNGELADDIDEWLQLEPVQVTDTHRNDIMVGYIIHVLVLNLRTLLYLLIPVLVHWLQEQDCQPLRNVLRTLFMEYWLFLPHKQEYSDTYKLSYELIDPAEDPSLPVFWLLHRIGFWKQMIRDLKVTSPSASLIQFNTYDSLLLDSFAQSNWLLLSQVKADQLFEILTRNVQNPNNTVILMTIISQQILGLKASLKSATSSQKTFTCLNKSYSDVRNLIQAWLSFSDLCLFNSLDKGNDEIFSAIFQILKYIHGKCAQIISYLNKSWNTTRLTKIREMLHKFKFLCYHVEIMSDTSKILCGYYLDQDTPLAIDHQKNTAIVEFFSDMMAEHSQDADMANFLLWLYGKGTKESRELARNCFNELYTEENWQTSQALEHVHYILYE